MKTDPDLSQSKTHLAWHQMSVAQALEMMESSETNGINDHQARIRLQKFGPNRSREEEKMPLWRMYFDHVRAPMLVMLLVVGVLYLLVGNVMDACIVFGVVLTIATIEIVNERRSEKAIAALHRLAEPFAVVRRNGHTKDIPVEEVVPGDVLVLEAGRRVAADARIFESHSLLMDESALTGEAVGSDKDATKVLSADTPLAERVNLALAGTTVLRGRGLAVVVATGPNSELGRVAQLTGMDEEPRTQLQEALDQMAGWMVWVALVISVFIPLCGWLLADQKLFDMFLTGLALFFASVPEELPVIIAVILAFGSYRLSRQKTIARRQRTVETLGALSVVATDKTGTLTENRLTLREIWPAAQRDDVLRTAIICSDAAWNEGSAFGDPLDVGLLRAAVQDGIDVKKIRATHPLLDEFSFDSSRKRMSVTTRKEDGFGVWVKGAPEAVLERCSSVISDGQTETLTGEAREKLLDKAASFAAQGMRVLAFASKTVAAKPSGIQEAEEGLTVVGLGVLADPLRPEAADAIAECRAAGIRPILITGDHPLNARAVARQVGFDEDAPLLTGMELDRLTEAQWQETVRKVSIYARVSPEHKLRLVQHLKKEGACVALTGDGINDAPALSSADIGIAMGATGTDVARAAADMVLVDDNFANVPRAVREGRTLFDNLTKGVRYYLACKVALTTSVLLPTLLGLPVPFMVAQILIMELVMDLAASGGFLGEKAEGAIMRRAPRDRRQRFLNRSMIGAILLSAVGLFAAISVSYLLTWYQTGDLVRAQSMAFITWMAGHVGMAFNARSRQTPLLKQGLFSNRVLNIWGAGVGLLLILIATSPIVQTITRTVPLSGKNWALAMSLAVVGAFWLEIPKWLAWKDDSQQVSPKSAV
jgi:Ca2+-transporting ATPase